MKKLIDIYNEIVNKFHHSMMYMNSFIYIPGIGPTMSCWSQGYLGSASGFLALNLYPAERAVSVTLFEDRAFFSSGLLIRELVRATGLGVGMLFCGLRGCRGSFLAIEL